MNDLHQIDDNIFFGIKTINKQGFLIVIIWKIITTSM